MRIAFTFALALSAMQAAEIRGRIVDSSTGERLAKVKVSAAGVEAVSNPEGAFTLNGIADGEQLLRVTAVGYRPFQIRVTVPTPAEFDVALAPDTLRRSESVAVAAGAYVEETPSATSMTGNELKNLASVLADDPLRAVQGLPGVTSNDDFQSQISLRGAGFSRIGIYLDGVLLHSPYHTVQGDPNNASLTIFNGDMLDAVNLHAGAPPSRFADRTAGALDVQTREGDRKRFSVRGTVSASNAGAILEGPLARGKGSWLVTARKSYLQYLISRTSDDQGLAFAFSDVQGRVQYDVAKAWNVSLAVMHGTSGLDRTGAQLGLNGVFKSDYDFTLSTLSARYTPGRSFLATNRVALLRERYFNINRDARALGASGYGEWIWNGDATWQQTKWSALHAGSSVRRVRDDGYANRLTNVGFTRIDQYRGSGVRSGFYAQQSVNLASGKVQLAAGGRADHHTAAAATGAVATPYASISFQPIAVTRLSLAWGQYVQFPEIAQLFSPTGSRGLLPERATHYEATVEQRIGDRTRVRLQAYDRQDRDLLFRPQLDFRILNGRIVGGNLAGPIANTQRGYARGWSAFLQRRTANGLTGWIGYSWNTARVRDGVLRISYPSDFDQRHTVNVFGSYRLRPSVNLSLKWLYGSGFPLHGFFAGDLRSAFLSSQRNQVRMSAYQRADFRVNKAFIRDRWQLTLFAEVINLTNHDNFRYDGFGLDGRTGAVRFAFDKMFPILPSAGIVVEF